MKIDLLSIPLVNSYSVSDTDLQRADFPPLCCHDVDAGDIVGDLVVKAGVPRDERPPAWDVVGGVGCCVLDPSLRGLSGVSPGNLVLILNASNPPGHVRGFAEITDALAQHEVKILGPSYEVQSATSAVEILDRAGPVIKDDTIHLGDDGLDFVLEPLGAINPTRNTVSNFGKQHTVSKEDQLVYSAVSRHFPQGPQLFVQIAH